MYALKLDITVTEPIFKELELSGHVFLEQNFQENRISWKSEKRFSLWCEDKRTDRRVHMKSSSWLRKEPLKLRCLCGLPCITLKLSLVKEIVFSYLTPWVSVLLVTSSYIQIKHASYDSHYIRLISSSRINTWHSLCNENDTRLQQLL